MKNKLLTSIVAIAFVFAITSFIGFSKNDKNVLQGMWELTQGNKPVGMMKVFNADGTISNIAHGREGFVITMEGSYRVNSGSAYTEKISKSFYASLNNKENEVKYAVDGNTLFISFSVAGKEYKETYRKVSFLKEDNRKVKFLKEDK